MSSKKLLVVAAVAALGLCFAQGASALHGGVSGGIKFKLSGTFECLVNPGEMTSSLVDNGVDPAFVKFQTAQGKEITCTRTVGATTDTGKFTGSFRTTGTLTTTCDVLPTVPASSKQTISSICSGPGGGDVQGTLTVSSTSPGDFVPSHVYAIGGADAAGVACATVFPDTLPDGLPLNVILQTEQTYLNSASCGAGEFSSGDVVAATGSGEVRWHRGSGAFEKLLTNATCGTGSTRGMAFDSANNLYVTMFFDDTVCQFDKKGDELGVFGDPFLKNPESIVFDAAGDAYVGKAGRFGGTRNIDKVDGLGNAVATFPVAVEEEGSDWIELACDQKTMFYTSEGRKIFRYDVSTSTQLADFVTLPGSLPAERAFALRIIPSGPLAGQVLVADWANVKRIDTTGTVVATYDVVTGDSWFSLDLDANGIHFYAINATGSYVHRFEIAGAGPHLPVQSSFVQLNSLAGVRVKHGLNCGTQPAPSATVVDGAMKMRPCGAENVGTGIDPSSCLHRDENNDLVPVVNDVNTLLQPTGVPAVSSPENINIKNNKKKEGIWVAILENEFVSLGTIDPALLKVEGVAPNTKKGAPQCVLEPGVSLRCRYSKDGVAAALRSRYPGVVGGTAVFMKVTSGAPIFDTNAVVNLVP